MAVAFEQDAGDRHAGTEFLQQLENRQRDRVRMRVVIKPHVLQGQRNGQSCLRFTNIGDDDLQHVPASPQKQQVSRLDTARSDECQMLADERGIQPGGQPAEGI